MRQRHRLKRHRVVRLLALIPAVAVFVASLGSVTQGHDPTDFWNSEWRRGRGTSDDRPREGGWDRWNDRDSNGDAPRERASRKAPTPSQQSGGAYCVRTCDGFYFPLSSPQQNNAKAQVLCQALCPGATTEVYHRNGGTDSMDQARNRNGKTYASLPEAFAYRKSLKPDCSCRSADTAPMSVANDPTLRFGDLVVTEAGVQVFRGSSQLPHKDRDFVDYRNSRDVASMHRSQLDAMVRKYYTVRAHVPAAREKAKQAAQSLRSSWPRNRQ